MNDIKEYTHLISCEIPHPCGVEVGELEVNKELMQSILEGSIKPTAEDLHVILKKIKLDDEGKTIDDEDGNVMIEKIDSHVVAFTVMVHNHLTQQKEKGLSLEETKELIDLIEDFGEDSMIFYCKWQEKRPIDFPEASDMRAIRKYVEEFGVFKKLLKEVLLRHSQGCLGRRRGVIEVVSSGE